MVRWTTGVLNQHSGCTLVGLFFRGSSKVSGGFDQFVEEVAGATRIRLRCHHRARPAQFRITYPAFACMCREPGIPRDTWCGLCVRASRLHHTKLTATQPRQSLHLHLSWI